MVERTGDETLEEWLVAQVGVVLLEVLGGGSDELDGGKLEAGRVIRSGIGIANAGLDLPTALEAGDDLTDDATL